MRIKVLRCCEIQYAVQPFKACIGSRAPYCRTVLQNGQDKIPTASQRSNLSWNTYQDFLKIPSHWEAALGTEWRCFSKVILESNVTLNITTSSDSFSIIQPIVNADDWGCIVRNMDTIIVLVLLAFNFIRQMSHHSLTLTRSRPRDYATVSLTPGMVQQISKWSES